MPEDALCPLTPRRGAGLRARVLARRLPELAPDAEPDAASVFDHASYISVKPRPTPETAETGA